VEQIFGWKDTDEIVEIRRLLDEKKVSEDLRKKTGEILNIENL